MAVSEAWLDTRNSPTIPTGSEWVTRLSPGVRWASRSGRVQGSLDYVANMDYRTGRPDTEGTSLQNALNANVIAEAIPNWAFIDFAATVALQPISAYGQQTTYGSLQSNPNQTDVASALIAPYVRGSLAGLADYNVRAEASTTSTKLSSAPSSKTTGGSAVLNSPTTGALLGWSLTGTQQHVEFDNSPATEDDRVYAGLSVSPLLELRFTLSAGHEWYDDGVSGRQSYNTGGVGVQWTPSPRTHVSASAEERYFGRSAHFSFDHRLQHSVFAYTYSRDTTSSADPTAFSKPITLLQLLSDQAVSAQPDPALREQAVRDFLRQIGRDPNEVITSGFLVSSVSLQERQELSFALLGRRTTFNAQAYVSDVRSIVTVADAGITTGEPTRQFGYSATLSHQLTPQTSINLNGTRQKTLDSPTQIGNDLKAVTLALTGQLSPRTNALLGARYSVFNSPTDPFRETAITGSLSLRF
jgi:uncharacterized protein (PEP-CTERM system associated)